MAIFKIGDRIKVSDSVDSRAHFKREGTIVAINNHNSAIPWCIQLDGENFYRYYRDCDFELISELVADQRLFRWLSK